MANTSQAELRNIVMALKSEFSVKVNWEPNKILGINLQYDRVKGITILHQRDKIHELEDLIDIEYNNNVKLPSMPIDNSVAWYKSNNKHDVPLNEEESSKYRTLLGKLMYIMTATRPDLCFAVSLLSRFNQNPLRKHMYGIVRTIKYLIATSDKQITFKRHPMEMYKLVAYI